MEGPGHVLIVPPRGLLEVIHAEHPINPHETLLLRSPEGGRIVHLAFQGAHVYWLHDETGLLNPRARSVFEDLSGAHVVFTGHVLFTGIAEHTLGEIVARLSLRDPA